MIQGAAILLLAGVAAGFCFVSKQNVGLYALTALSLTVALSDSSRNTRLTLQGMMTAMILISAGFMIATLLVLFPVWLSGGTEKFLEHGFLDKGVYIRFARLSYLYGLGQLAFFPQHLDSWEHLQSLYRESMFLLPPLAVAALSVTWICIPLSERRVFIIMGLFVSVALMSIFPRADNAHVTWAVPLSLLSLLYAWRHLTPSVVEACPGRSRRGLLTMPPQVHRGGLRASSWGFLLRVGLVLWLGLGLSVALIPPFERLFSSRYQISTLPHFHGVLIRDDHHAAGDILSRSLVAAIADKQPCLLISPVAPFFYLVSGLKNPTPFDYPLVNTFGVEGEADVITAIERRHIRTVCLGPLGTRAMTPVRLEHYVRTQMESGGDLAFCTCTRLVRELEQTPFVLEQPCGRRNLPSVPCRLFSCDRPFLSPL